MKHRYLTASLTIAFLLITTGAWAGGMENYRAGCQANKSFNYEQAIMLLTLAIESGELEGMDLASAHFSRAFALKKSGKFNEAISDYDKALKLSPSLKQDQFFLNARGAAYIGAGDYSRALKDIEASLVLDSEYASAYNSRGIVHSKKGEFDKAIIDHQKAIELNSHFWLAMSELAWLRATCPDDGIRDADEAVMWAEKAAHFRRNHKTLDVLAAAYASANRFEEAVKVQELAMEMLVVEHQLRKLEELEKRLESYKAGKAWRNSPIKQD